MQHVRISTSAQNAHRDLEFKLSLPNRCSNEHKISHGLGLSDALDFAWSELKTSDPESWYILPFSLRGLHPFKNAGYRFCVIHEGNRHGFAQNHSPAILEFSLFRVEFLTPLAEALFGALRVEVELSLIEIHEIT